MKRTALQRRTPISTKPGVQLRRDTPIAAVGKRARAERPEEDAARAIVMDRDRGRCQYPHHLMSGLECSAPHGMRLVAGEWVQNPENRGVVQLCHCIPRGIAGPWRWNAHNLFAGCDAGNAWQEDHTEEAFALGVQAHFWEQVRNGRRIPT